MKTEITEIMKHNYAIDFTGVGNIEGNMSPTQIKQMIESDIINSFDCITHLNSLVKLEESIKVGNPAHLSIHLYMKILEHEDKDSILQIIASYITKTFLK